jgi:cytochrome P450
MNRYPPGPTDWFFGLRLIARIRREPLDFLLHTVRTYGDITHMRVFGRHAYLVHEPDAIRDVLVTKGKSFSKVEQFMRPFRKVDGNGLVFSSGDFWLRQRRLVQPAFHAGRMGRYADAMVEQARRMVERWRSGMEINIADVMTHLTLDIVGKTLFGVELTGQESQLREAVRVLSEAFTREANAVLNLPDWLPLPSKRRKRAAVQFLDQFIRNVIRQRRASSEDRGDLLSMLLLAVDEEGDGRGMTDEQARDEAMTLFNAGHDSTAAGLTWIWYLVAKHPAVQARIMEEIDAALGDRPATGMDLPRLAYTEQVVKEALRLYPPTWSLFPREALTDVKIGGYVLPKGSWVSILPWVMHRDRRWFPEPERFDPERFGPGRLEQIPKYAYIPFGAGPHICIGSAFATMEMTLVLATVLQQFRVELAPGQRDAEPEPLIALRPRGGVRLTLTRRQSSRAVRPEMERSLKEHLIAE